MVLQIMVAALFVGGCERVARSFACAKNQPTRMVERDSPSDPRHSRSIGPASRSARTISFGGCADDPSRAGLSGVRALAFAAYDRASLAVGRPNVARISTSALHVTHSNQRHQVDLIGPRYLKGLRRQWFFLVYRDVFDGAVFVEFQPKPRLETVLAFVVCAWQRLGLPDVLQVDNSDVFGLTSHPGSLSRFVRLALLVGIDLTYVPEHEPWRNGAIEHFNGWLRLQGVVTSQERLLAIPLHSPSQVRRELLAMMDTCFREHIHPDLNFQTTAQVRQNLSPRTLPHNFRRHLQPLPVPIGRVTFIRRVRQSGRITILGAKFQVGKRLAHQYVTAILYTRTMILKIHSGSHLIKQFDFPFVGKQLL